MLRDIKEAAARECKECPAIQQCFTYAFLEQGLNVEPAMVNLIVASRNPPKAFGNALKKHVESGGGPVVTLWTATSHSSPSLLRVSTLPNTFC